MGHRLPRRGQLVTDGIYRYLGHRQNLGLILVVVGFNIMWPTLLIVVMAPVLIATYVRLARREDEELARAFGEAFLEYGALTPALVPWGGGRRILDGKRPSRVRPSFLPTPGGARAESAGPAPRAPRRRVGALLAPSFPGAGIRFGAGRPAR
jgi:hypothetical protein